MSHDAAIPRAPPLPALKSFQRARDAANRIFGYASRPPSPQDERPAQPPPEGRRGSGRLAPLGASQNATATHRTGLEIKTLSINESGTHALLGGKDIFKTIRVENGVCVEDINLRAAIRSNPTQASGKPRQIYNIDIADVAWAKGDTGEFVAAATESGKIIIYDLGHAGLPAAQLHEHYRQVHRITCNPHKGSLLLSGSQDGTVRLWDVRDAKQPVGATRTRSNVQSKSKFAGTTDGVRDVKWSPTDAMDFAFATDGGSVQVWDMRYFNRPKVKIIAHSSTCMSVDWHPDGKHLASAGLDHMIKVWDTGVKSGRKGNWEVKTPYPLSNARWRPACEIRSSDDDDNTTRRQCTQLLAAYDRSHPELHIWDLRRPALPFRELAPYTEAPTDLLWHSQDLLWTVGRDGTFVQNDIQHSSLKVMDRYPVNASAISPTGEIASFNIRRSLGPAHRHRRASSSHVPDASLLSRSWADDSLDDSFLRAHPEVVKQKQRRPHSRQSSDVGIPIYPTRTSVISLDQVFGQRKAVRPTQTAWRGQLPPAYCTDPLVFEYMAQQSCPNWQTGLHESEDLSNVDVIFRDHSALAENVGLYRLATRWEVLGLVTTEHLKRRAKKCETITKLRTTHVDGTPSYMAGELAGMTAACLTRDVDVTRQSMHAATISHGSGSATGQGEPESIAPSTEAKPVHASTTRHATAARSFLAPSPCIAAHAHVEVEYGNPFELGAMLRDLLITYTQHLPDAQTAAHLILALAPCLPTTRPLLRSATSAAVEVYTSAYSRGGYEVEEIPTLLQQSLTHIINAGLQPLQLETILSTYHEQLIAHRCFVEAAALRLTCYPAFPTVYEQSLRDNEVALMCGHCGSPKDTARCASCASSPAVCPVCQCRESAFTTEQVGPSLWSQCLHCNHGGHAACLRAIHEGEGLKGCPTTGCLCGCSGLAQRSELARAGSRKTDEVLKDSMIATESSAVAALRR